MTQTNEKEKNVKTTAADGKAICRICPRACQLTEEQLGWCRGRVARGGEVVSANYGKVTSIALDPMEKKPLRRFASGRTILSVGSYGCNLACSFCQNSDISMGGEERTVYQVTPEFLVKRALEMKAARNVGLAFTYNEPLIGYEFVRDCAQRLLETDLKNVVVTNGYICEEPLAELLPLIHAWNIDLKSISEDFYRSIGGDLATVQRTIRQVAEVSHVELTFLVIPGLNDTKEEMEQMVDWICSVDPEMPLHISRFRPAFKMTDRAETPVETLKELVEIARRRLKYVYPGNLRSSEERF
ncbi:MAG TPA: AmmeMemoRadiSam system radical SAM enzyme [Clostridiales bacterium]|jgi:pyruvate formate lyase activating enzyme|nr:AmmeMemoRadiSam system radical SAM enzyme [Clostridiales bacterium]